MTGESPRVPLAMRPQGAAGKAFGVLMEAINAPAYRFALDLLELGSDSDVLEIGFGTGRMIEIMLSHTAGRIVGVDPTPTMVEVARARRSVRRESAQLTLGADGDLDHPDASFDRVVALHSFQFWPEPGATIRHLRRMLRPKGRLVLVLRDHSRRPADWLPNPISRGGDEAEAARGLIAESGFEAHLEKRGRMVGVVGDVR